MTCAVHTDQPATSYCRTCGKALCQSCQRDVRGVIYCQDCLAARLEGTVPPAAATMPTTVYVAPVSSASPGQIGRASCRERGERSEGDGEREEEGVVRGW